MREVGPFIKALLRQWWFVASTAASGIVSAVAESMQWPMGAKVWLSLGAVFLFVAAFLAWRKEYLDNIGGPELILHWHSNPRNAGEGARWDQVEFINRGSDIAIDIRLGDFSLPELAWTHPITVPDLETGTSHRVEAHFQRIVNQHGHVEICYLRHVLHALKEGEQPLEITLSYSNLRGTRFRRSFELLLTDVGLERVIQCRPGKLEVKR